MQFLLDLGADVNATNAVGRSALHGAAHIRSDAAVRLLFDHGATVEVADQRGITPLMIAEGGGHILLPGLGGGEHRRAAAGARQRGDDRELHRHLQRGADSVVGQGAFAKRLLRGAA